MEYKLPHVFDKFALQSLKQGAAGAPHFQILDAALVTYPVLTLHVCIENIIA